MSDSNDKPLDLMYAEMQRELAKALLDRIRSGGATAADLNVARQLLKDNHIQSATPQANPSLAILGSIPFPVKPGEQLA